MFIQIYSFNLYVQERKDEFLNRLDLMEEQIKDQLEFSVCGLLGLHNIYYFACADKILYRFDFSEMKLYTFVRYFTNNEQWIK
jgi:hypothetical protein